MAMFESYSSRANQSAVDKLIQMATGRKVAAPVEEEPVAPEAVTLPEESAEGTLTAGEPSAAVESAPEAESAGSEVALAEQPETGMEGEPPAAGVEPLAGEEIDDRPFHEPLPEPLPEPEPAAEAAVEVETVPAPEIAPESETVREPGVEAAPVAEAETPVEAASEPVAEEPHFHEGSSIGFHAVSPVEEGAAVEAGVEAAVEAEAMGSSEPTEPAAEDRQPEAVEEVAPVAEEGLHAAPVEAAGEPVEAAGEPVEAAAAAEVALPAAEQESEPVEGIAAEPAALGEPGPLAESAAPVAEEAPVDERPFHDSRVEVPVEAAVENSAEAAGATEGEVAEAAATEPAMVAGAEEPRVVEAGLESGVEPDLESGLESGLEAEPAAAVAAVAADELAGGQERPAGPFVVPGGQAAPVRRVRKIPRYGEIEEEPFNPEKYLPLNGEQGLDEADLVPSPDETTYLKSKTREIHRDKVTEEELKELAQDPMWKTLMQFKGWLPVVTRVLPLLDMASGRSQSGAGTSEEIRNSMEGLLVSHRDVRATLQSQTVELKRVEDEVVKLRDAADKTAYEQTALADDIRGLQRLFKNAFLYVGILLGLLVAVMGYMAFLVFSYLNHPMH